MTSGRRIAGTISMAALLLAAGAAQAHAEPAVALLPGNQITRFDTNSPGTILSTVGVMGLGANETLRGIDVRPATGELYGVAATAGSPNNSVLFTYRINPVNGAATLVGQTLAAVAGGGDVPSGYDFNPAADRIRYVNTNDENARLNPSNGARVDSDDTDLNPSSVDIIAAAYDRDVSGATVTTLWAIDRTTFGLARIGGLNGVPSPNGGAVTNVGPLGVSLTTGRDGGFDISPAGNAYAALTVGAPPGTTNLYTINLAPGFGATGAATLVGAIGGAPAEVYSLAILAADADGDGVPNSTDDCNAAANADQADGDADGIGDVCDNDSDNDGLSNAVETAIGSNPNATDSDGDGVGDGGDACPTLPGTPPNGCPDIALPDTTKTKGPKGKTSKRKATLEFTSTEAGSTFACSLDHKAFKPCVSPQKYKHLKVGKHFADVRAIDAAGNLDPTPASWAWTIKK